MHPAEEERRLAVHSISRPDLRLGSVPWQAALNNRHIAMGSPQLMRLQLHTHCLLVLDYLVATSLQRMLV